MRGGGDPDAPHYATRAVYAQQGLLPLREIRHKVSGEDPWIFWPARSSTFFTRYMKLPEPESTNSSYDEAFPFRKIHE